MSRRIVTAASAGKKRGFFDSKIIDSQIEFIIRNIHQNIRRSVETHCYIDENVLYRTDKELIGFFLCSLLGRLTN